MPDSRRLTFKPPHQPLHCGGYHVRFGGGLPGVRLDVIDRDGSVWRLACLLDGSHTADEVVAEMATTHPGTPEGVVRAMIDDLERAGHLEDAEDPGSGLDADAWVRYSRGIAFYQWVNLVPRRPATEIQFRLGQASALVIGLGGTGCTAADDLVRSGVGHVHCVDRDIVESSDLNRQGLYHDEDIGAFKVEVAVPRLRSHNPTVEVTGEVLDVDGLDLAHDLASRFDVVLLAADEPREIRTWINQASLATSTPWVHSGYHGPLISMGLYRPGAGPCFDCRAAEQQAHLARLPARTEWPPAGRMPRVHAANAVSAGLAGNYAAHATISLITGVPALATNREYSLNLLTLTSGDLTSLDSPSPRCPSCGPTR